LVKNGNFLEQQHFTTIYHIKSRGKKAKSFTIFKLQNWKNLPILNLVLQLSTESTELQPFPSLAKITGFSTID